MDKKRFKWIMDNKKAGAMLLAVVVFINVLSIAAFASSGAVTTDSIGGKISCVLCKLASLVYITAGAIASLVIIMAGLRWVTSADDPGARNAAKTTIISAFVGLIIIILAVFIVALVLNNIPGMDGVDPMEWMTGGCDSICTNAGFASR
jgi:disulfide bond formation protein DsbB